jgi:hypothetical protein
MTDYAAQFAATYPKPVNIPGSDYAAHKDKIDAAAFVNGYRLAGIHPQSKEAVFSTKS